MQRKDGMPQIVYWGLLGVNSRGTAMMYLVGCLVITIALAFLGSYILAVCFAVALIWYWYAIRWVDKHSSWEE